MNDKEENVKASIRYWLNHGVGKQSKLKFWEVVNGLQSMRELAGSSSFEIPYHLFKNIEKETLETILRNLHDNKYILIAREINRSKNIPGAPRIAVLETLTENTEIMQHGDTKIMLQPRIFSHLYQLLKEDPVTPINEKNENKSRLDYKENMGLLLDGEKFYSPHRNSIRQKILKRLWVDRSRPLVKKNGGAFPKDVLAHEICIIKSSSEYTDKIGKQIEEAVGDIRKILSKNHAPAYISDSPYKLVLED